MSISDCTDSLGKLVFKMPLPEKVPNYTMVLMAKLQDGCRKFAINFCRDENIVYHFGLQEDRLYQGACAGSDWLSRASCSDWEAPESGTVRQVFRFGDKAEVEHNGSFLDFDHQIPFHPIQHVELWGDIECVQQISFKW